MKKRIVKKQNKKQILALLAQLVPLRACNIKLGSGYFIFKIGENAVCHFGLKELPHWKFGIWLNEDKTYTTFGQVTNLIDKFKPSYSDLVDENILSFRQKVLDIIANGGFLNDEDKESYLEDLDIRKKAAEWNLKAYGAVQGYIDKYNEANQSRYLKLEDRGARVMPRYRIALFHERDKDVVGDELKKLQEEIDLVCNIDREGLPCYYLDSIERGRW